MKTVLDLRVSQRIHIVGVGGPGMSAIALALAEMGHSVTGSDIKESPVLDRLRASGVGVTLGHDSHLVEGCSAVTASPAIPVDNVEVHVARTKQLFLTRAEMLAALCAVRPTLAVVGTHGKTTTTSLVVHIFETLGRRPNFIVGGDIKGFRTSARWSDGDWTIVEADESDGTHLQLPVAATVLTNIDVDHLDHYGDFAGIVDAFSRYLDRVKGPRVVCIDDTHVAEILSALSSGDRSEYLTYGTSDAHVRCDNIVSENGSTSFEVHWDDVSVHVTTSLRGKHNVLNITGALAVSVACGLDPVLAAASIQSFEGVGRRFDIRGVIDDITLVDDYAHLPTEIDAVLTAARSSGDGWRRIVAVFQPNRFNRMSLISAEYAHAFRCADVVVITDIYASGTARIEGVTGQLVVDAILANHPQSEVVWVPNRDDLAPAVLEILEAGDVCISMGCGDIEHLPEEILALRRRADVVP